MVGLGSKCVSKHVPNLSTSIVLLLLFRVLGWGGLGLIDLSHHPANLTVPMVLPLI